MDEEAPLHVFLKGAYRVAPVPNFLIAVAPWIGQNDRNNKRVLS